MLYIIKNFQNYLEFMPKLKQKTLHLKKIDLISDF